MKTLLRFAAIAPRTTIEDKGYVATLLPSYLHDDFTFSFFDYPLYKHPSSWIRKLMFRAKHKRLYTAMRAWDMQDCKCYGSKEYRYVYAEVYV